MMAAKERVLDWLEGHGVEFLSLEGITENGTLHSVNQLPAVKEYLQTKDIDGLFLPHCNFGSEEPAADLARFLGKPVLLWGERDSGDRPHGRAATDRQCGLFATSKVLRRYNVPFTYIENCSLESPVFEEGMERFLRVAHMVKRFRSARVGMIDTRPTPFLTMMANEGELVEKFGISVVPTSLGTIVESAKAIEKEGRQKETARQWQQKIDHWQPDAEATQKLAAFKLALQEWAEANQCSALVIQCWSALQKMYGISTCFVNAELTEEGIPVACETDVHGAITSILVEAAANTGQPSFFADLTIRHPDNSNGELLWHCGPFSHCLKDEQAQTSVDPQGRAGWPIQGGPVTLVRFDGDHGEYSLFWGRAQGIDGPETFGTYLWVEVNDWPRWERELIYGPYVHHVVGIHGDISAELREFCRYVPGIQPHTVD